ncbi:MAG: hypothetical protein ABJB03_04645 [Rhodoglobus sp.]
MKETTGPSAASAEEARVLLGAAGTGARAGASLSRSTAVAERTFAAVLGACIALFLLSVVYIYPLGNPLLTVVVTVVYAAGIVAAILVFARVRTGASAGWGRRYVVGFIATMVIYCVGVLVFSRTGLTAPAFWAPYALATALPVFVASFVGSRR